ncbi:multidrug efflux RND transporter permease subunit [Oceanisphaera sp. KMM 10153]|uniref:multidrug efflux RND transporter permease subunit n=1 Tax=Oceanisphaera submarina TaxID=3390193 RepID=UPI003974ABAD
MRFTDIFIKRPVLAVSISLLIVLLGLQALQKMQVREYPEMTNTVITVSTGYFGASADLIQGFITQPLEQAIAQADNIDFMSSSSSNGSSKITVQMKLNTDPNAALSDILARVNSVRSQLPRESEDPSLEMTTGASTSIMYISFSSEQLNAPQINDYLERVIRPQFYSVDGVAKINLFGGAKFALRIWLDPLRMAAHQLTAPEVLSVLQSNNYQAAAGQATGYFMLYNSDINTQIESAEQLESLVVATRDDAVVRLRDIGQVSLEKSHDVVRALADGESAVIIGVDPTPSANPLSVADNVRKMLPSLERNMPDTIKMKLLYDATDAINESINEVVKTILEASLIVIIVITLFLGSLRAVLIPIVTIPLSLIGVAILMSFFGFSINLMTLLAMVLAIGLVVDDAIVVVENVDRHIKAGESPYRAAIIGTREIAVPVITMTITLAAVYAPIALMSGITGSLFKEFALTLAGAVFISGIVALTLSPMMCSKLLKPHNNPNRFERGVENTLDKLTASYARMLDAVLAKRPVVIAFAVLVFGSMPVLFGFIPSELAPSEDKGAFLMMAKAPNSANLDYIENNMRKAVEVLNKEDGLATSLTIAGVPNANQGLAVAVLKPWSQRDSQQAVIERVTPPLQAIPAVAISAFGFPELPGASSGLPVQYVLTTPNSFESLYAVAAEMLGKVSQSPLFVYSELDLAFDSGTMKIKVNRDKAGAYGVTMQDIAITLSTMMSDGYVNRVDLDGRSYEVIPQVFRKDRLNPDSIKDYYVRAHNGDMVPLANLVSITMEAQPRSLPHYNQLNSATIGAVLTPGVSMGDAIGFLEQDVTAQLPNGYNHDYLGAARQFVTEGNALYMTFLLALFIIFLVLASQFESVRDPLVIMVSVPLAISGALIALAWGLATMNIYTQVGLITLVGIITKHGILMCEVAKEEQLHRGLDRTDAIRVAARIRLRAILMTTAAMVAGLIPLLFAVGAGAVSRFGMGIVIVSGLSIGTLFTLFVLPVIYTFIASHHKPLPEFDEDQAPKALGNH